MYQIYLKVQAIFQEKYGPQTVILMQVGKFFEMYTVMSGEVTPSESEVNLHNRTDINLDQPDFSGADPEVSKILDIAQNLKNGKLPPSPSNPYMMGFPLSSLDRYLEKLIANNWTAIQINQISLEDYHEKIANSATINSSGFNTQNYLLEVQRILNPCHSKTHKLLHEPRWIHAIHSPGTYINPSHQQADGLYLTGVFIQGETRGQMTVALVNINLETSESHCYQVSSTTEDPNLALDETIRFLSTYPSRELQLTIHQTEPELYRHINSYLSLASQNLCDNVIYCNDFPKDFLKLSFQESLLKQVFPDTGRLGPIAYLDICQYPSLVVAICLFYQFVYEHNENILNRIAKPIFWETQQHLTLDSNCINQLELINSHSLNSDRYRGISIRNTSIFNLIDWTVTPSGRRMLKERLLNPIQDPEILNQRYAYIQAVLDFQPTTLKNQPKSEPEPESEPEQWWNLSDFIAQKLRRSPDYVLLHRRVSRAELDPCAFKVLDQGYLQLSQILNLIVHDPILQGLIKDASTTQSDVFLSQFQDFQKYYQSHLDLELASQLNLNNLADSFFKPGHYSQLDDLSQTIRDTQEQIQILAFKLSQLVDPKVSNNLANISPSGSDSASASSAAAASWPVKIKVVDSDHYLNITVPRYQKLKAKSASFPLSFGKISIKFTDLEINKESRGKGSKSYDLICPQLKKLSDRLFEAQESLNQQVPEIYRNFLRGFDQKYHSVFQTINSLVSQLDLYQSQARTALKYHYCHPVAHAIDNENGADTGTDNSSSGSWVKVKKLRHALAEQVNKNSLYVPHDLSLISDECEINPTNPKNSTSEICHQGLLVFGLNGSGKSVLMKALGTAIIMAQAGFFVPAEDLQFAPYQHILTRILGNDNIHKGLSSFEVEMSELSGILARANNRSLVLGDEICRGTENVSGTSIVATSLLHLLEVNANFIFASHLHQLILLNEIKASEPKLGIYHLKLALREDNPVTHDPGSRFPPDNQSNRKLTPGPGSSVYGLDVARAMKLSTTFCDKADRIRRNLEGIPQKIQPIETSVYNKQVYRPNLCPVCRIRKPIETHHILPQREADSNGFIRHIPKNHPQNLIWLCRECHLQVEFPVDGKLLVVTSPTKWKYQILTT